MVKIEIENRVVKEQEYIDSIFAVVLNRINILQKSIEHLSGLAINYNGVNFDSLRTTTRKIINKIEKRNDSEDLYLINNYDATVFNYINAPNTNLLNINLIGLRDLLDYLTQINNLKNLLKCSPSQLWSLNHNLLNNYNIINSIDKDILKFAFNYDYPEISSLIKKYFRDNNFVKICPYCNYFEVEYLESPIGQVAVSHHLDHFFYKATFPLLSYSMYNLIPSDYNCNSTNKGSIEFMDDYHLNPYIEGFGNSMNFVPIQLGSKIKVDSIDIKINENRGSRKYNQLIGDNPIVEEADINGNINVFKLLTRYRGRTTKAENILECLQKTDKGFNAIGKFLRLLNPNDKNNYYLEWYRKQIRTPFEYSEFNNEAFSKFNRDIHDYYYSLNPSITNRHIRELIEANNA